MRWARGLLLGPGRGRRDGGRGLKSPHRFRPKTPESASPPGEGEDADPSGVEKKKTGGSQTPPLRMAHHERIRLTMA